MTIILLLLIPVIIAITGFICIKAVHLGLRWQIQATKGETPTLDIPNPIAPIVEARQEKETTNIFNEWVHGER